MHIRYCMCSHPVHIMWINPRAMHANISPREKYDLLCFFTVTPLCLLLSESKPLADLQCEDSRQGLLHGCSVSRGHEDLDGCNRHRCWGIHPVHGVVKGSWRRDTPRAMALCGFKDYIFYTSFFVSLDFFKRLDVNIVCIYAEERTQCLLCWESCLQLTQDTILCGPCVWNRQMYEYNFDIVRQSGSVQRRKSSLGAMVQCSALQGAQVCLKDFHKCDDNPFTLFASIL